MFNNASILPLLAPICNRCLKGPVRNTCLFNLEGTDYNRANGTDYKSASAEQNTVICELGEAKSAPAGAIKRRLIRRLIKRLISRLISR
jgi:hypothetical protein